MFKKSRRKKKNENVTINEQENISIEEKANILDEMSKNIIEDPYYFILTILNNIGDKKVAIVAVLLKRALDIGFLNEKDLQLLGIDKEEMESISNSVYNNKTYDDLEMELNVISAVREYDLIMDKIIKENNLDESKKADFRTDLAKISLDNSITDIEVAFKYKVATEPDWIKSYKKSNDE